MDRSGMRRILLGCLLLGLLGAQLVHYGASPAGSPSYPGADALERNPDRHVGAKFYAWTHVVGRSSDGLVVRTGDVRLTIVDPTVTARPGYVLQVYGTLATDGRVFPTRLVVSDRGNLRYLYGISLLAAVLTAGLGYSRWRFDRRTLCFVPREAEDDA